MTSITSATRQPQPLDSLPRCCTAHADWATLAQHLVDEFPDVAINDIVREVSAAREATEVAGLADDEGLATGELIVRHQLMLLAGHITDVARLDPATHARRSGSSDCAADGAAGDPSPPDAYPPSR